ncbi:MAG TPA: hypothetical protein DEO95_03710, partial [Ruminococcaceae bacterium]|nr:hypothetical protein [Oscillospiraceae bacterium]
GLQEITADGDAKTYSLKPMTEKVTPLGPEIIKPIPVYEVAGTTASEAETLYTDASADYYQTLATNEGVRSNVIDRAYNGAELSLVLTGKTDFKGPLEWFDNAKQSERETAVADGTAGDFLLYRYVDTNTNNNAHDSQMVAQVGTWNINGEADSGQYIYRDSNNSNPDTNTLLDKYDNTGAAYVYFAKERLKLDEYEVDYVHAGIDVPNLAPFGDKPDDAKYNDTPVFYNGATVKNSLTGEVGYGVDAEWIAAELQGGTGSITYQIQYLDADGNWQNCTYQEGDNTV